MAKPDAVHTCAPPPIPSHLSVIWAFYQCRLQRRGVDGAIPRDEWPGMLLALGVIEKPDLLDEARFAHLQIICYDLQERGWLPGLKRLYNRGIWNARTDEVLYKRFLRLWLKHWNTCAPRWRAIGLVPGHRNPLP